MNTGTSEWMDTPISRRHSLHRFKDTSASSHGHSKAHVIDRLQILFPDIDTVWLDEILTRNYADHSTDADIIEILTHKLLDLNKGQYPSTPRGVSPTSIVAKNHVLQTLVSLFPIADVRWLRTLISKFNCAILHRCIDAIIETEANTDTGYPTRFGTFQAGSLLPQEQFKSEDYIRGARHRLYNDFPDHFSSTIKSVMAELNHDYVSSYLKLRTISSKSFWNTMFGFIKRKTYDDIEMQFPEVLDDVARLKKVLKEEQLSHDAMYAQRINQEEYEQNSQLIACNCCFDDVPFEELIQCTEGHVACKSCLNRYVREGLYGQGMLRGKPVPCLSETTCTIREEELKRGLEKDLFEQYCDTLVEEEFKSAGLTLLRCPFCQYKELDQLSITPATNSRLDSVINTIRQIQSNIGQWNDRMDAAGLRELLAMFGLFIFIYLVVNPPHGVPMTSWTAFLILVSTFLARHFSLFIQPIRSLLTFISHHRDNWSPYPRVFICRNPTCSRYSCRECGKDWKPLHKCFEREVDMLRTFVEERLTEVFTRTCPVCALRFTKLDGCNKMTCPNCGYIMCFVCRRDIRTEKYQHFCEHFRPLPGPCTQCTKCDLYKVDDDARAMRETAQQAKEEWLNANERLRMTPEGERIWKELVGFDVSRIGLSQN